MAKATISKTTTARNRAPAKRTAAVPDAAPSAAAVDGLALQQRGPAVADAAPAVAAVEETETEPKVFVRKKELIERVVAVSGMKKKDVKPAVEAMLSVLGQALSNGEALNINPLGKVQVNRKKQIDNAEVLITRIRRNTKAAIPPVDPLAATAK